MHIPQNSTWGVHSSPEPQHELVELLDNPITYEIILIIAVVSFAMSMMRIMICLRCIDPDDDHYDYGDQQGDEEEAQPSNLTLTEDGDLLGNEDGGNARQYGTFYVGNGKWYRADGIGMSYNEWMEAVCDPLD